MATSVTVFNAARMQEIEDSAIVGGAINGSGHLILTKHDGSTIDAGNALVAVPDQRLVHILDSANYNSATPPISYPDGVSMMYISATEATADWTTFAGKWGSIITVNYPAGISADADTTQTWTRLHGSGTTPEHWIRSGNDAGGWSAWKRIVLADELTGVLYEQVLSPSTFNQSTVMSDYPHGLSWLYLSDVQSAAGGWQFGTQFGIVSTYKYSGDFAMQTWTRHAAGSANTTAIWCRTANFPSGWSAWTVMASPSDPRTMGFTGEIRMWPTNTAPLGWSFCDGGTLSRTTESALYGVIGTTFGNGDGSTTFNKPNFNGRVPVGYDGTQTEFDTMGETGGEKAHSLTIAEMPTHTHQVGVDTSNGWASSHPQALTKGASGFVAGTASDRPANSYADSALIATTGSGNAHNNLQPYITIRYIIKL